MGNWVCPVHGTVKFVPPGVSKKTGKPYQGFFCCAEQGCEERPPRGAAAQAPPQARQYPQQRPAPVAPNWDKIAEGKCRTVILCAWIQSSRPLGEFWGYERDFLAYAMAGDIPSLEDRLSWVPVDDPFPEA